MSMGSKRPGWRVGRDRYNRFTREIQNLAAAEKANNKYGQALGLCLHELWEYHREYCRNCEGGCPAHQAMAYARKVLGIEHESLALDLTEAAPELKGSFPVILYFDNDTERALFIKAIKDVKPDVSVERNP